MVSSRDQQLSSIMVYHPSHRYRTPEEHIGITPLRHGEFYIELVFHMWRPEFALECGEVGWESSTFPIWVEVFRNAC